MVAFCGLICDTCQVHLATIEPDIGLQKEMRSSIALVCNKEYGMSIQPEEVNDCDGCRAASGVLFSGCNSCPVRKCALLKNIETCAQCSNFICNILEEHFKMEPHCRLRLEELRN